jgi:hypothetical protein
MTFVVAFAHAGIGQMSNAAMVLDAEGLFGVGCRLRHINQSSIPKPSKVKRKTWKHRFAR